ALLSSPRSAPSYSSPLSLHDALPILMAAIVGLEALNRPCQVELYSDSKYLTDAFNQRWVEGWIKKNWTRGKNEPVKNVDLWQRRSEEHTSELQSRFDLVCRLLLEKKK